MQVGDFQAGVYYLLRLAPSSALFAPKCATNVLSDVRRTVKIVGGRVLILFVILCNTLYVAAALVHVQHCTQLQRAPHILLASDSFIHFSAV